MVGHHDLHGRLYTQNRSPETHAMMTEGEAVWSSSQREPPVRAARAVLDEMVIVRQ